MRTFVLRALALLCPFLCAEGSSAHPSPPRAPRGEQPPNVLLIVLDDVGFEKLEWWPYKLPDAGVSGFPQTPTLQALAAEGIVFTNYWSSPSCSAARTQILTGRDCHRTGIGAPTRPETATQLDPQELLLPELIRAGNPAYRTGAFGKWHITHGGQECHPTQHGFEIFQGHLFNVFELDATTQGSCMLGHHFWWDKVTSVGGSGCSSTTQRIGQPSGTYPASDWSSTVTVNDTLAWIGTVPPEEPFFAYVAFNSPHEPLQVPPHSLLSSVTLNAIASDPLAAELGPFESGYRLPCFLDPNSPQDPCSTGCVDFFASTCDEDDVRNVWYDRQRLRIRILNWMIESVDEEIRRLIAGLGDRLDDTVVFVVSDNGTAQREVDCPFDPRHAKLWPYQLGARVPLIVWGPRVIPETARGSERTNLVSAVDLWRTVAETTGMCPAEIDQTFASHHASGGTWTLDSISFFPLIADSSLLSSCGTSTQVPSRQPVIFEWFSIFRPHWYLTQAPSQLLDSLDLRRGVRHTSGLKFTHLLHPPQGNDTEDLLDTRSDPYELRNLARFFGLMPFKAPCLPFDVRSPPGPCNSNYCQLEACTAACDASEAACDAQVLLDIVGSFYIPRFCAATTSN